MLNAMNRRLRRWNRISRDLTIGAVGVVTAVVAMGVDGAELRLVVVALGATAIVSTWLLAKLQLRTWLWHHRKLMGFSSRHRHQVPRFLTRSRFTGDVVRELTSGDDPESLEHDRE
jgi:hypothetical protein